MRDAFGGAFMIKLFLVFIIIYVSFIALALNYAKAFKVKNQVIEYLEQEEIVDLKNLPAKDKDLMDLFFEQEILGKMNYKSSINCDNLTDEDYCQNGIRIEHMNKKSNLKNKDSNVGGTYYKVSTSFGWSIPFINKLLALSGRDKGAEVAFGRWIISGETRVIVRE